MTVDAELLARLRVVADELGARDLPLDVVLHALLCEAAEQLESKREAFCFARASQ